MRAVGVGYVAVRLAVVEDAVGQMLHLGIECMAPAQQVAASAKLPRVSPFVPAPPGVQPVPVIDAGVEDVAAWAYATWPTPWMATPSWLFFTSSGS